MLTLNTKLDLSKLLEIIGYAEVQIEKMREVLSRQQSFSLDPVFDRIAVPFADCITDNDLVRFMKSNNIDVNIEDIQLFFSDRGTSGSFGIDKTDLANILVTKRNKKLRGEVSHRSPYSLPKDHFLNFELEFTIARIIEYELNLLREIKHYVYLLNNKSDFSILDAFQEIDCNFTNDYNKKDLISFFGRCGKNLGDMAAAGSIQRLDRHDDDKVGIHDFTVLFDTYTGKYVPNGKQVVNIMNYRDYKNQSFANCMSFFESIAKKPQNNATRLHYVNGLGLKKKTFVENEGSLRSPSNIDSLNSNDKNLENAQLFDIKLQGFKSTLNGVLPNQMIKKPIARTKLKSKPFSSDSRVKKRVTLNNQNECTFQMMQTQLAMAKLDRELQHNLQDLSLRPDFTCIDLFRCIDIFGKGYVTVHEVMNGLEKFDQHPNKLDVSLLMKYHDHDTDGKLNLKEFSKMLTPFQREYTKMLKSRKGQSAYSLFDYEDVFSSATQNYIQKAYKSLLENTVAIESQRQRLSNKLGVEAHLMFNNLDMNKDGFISKKDLEKLFRSTKQDIDNDIIDFIIARFDKNHDKKINKVEFVKEFQPWSTVQC